MSSLTVVDHNDERVSLDDAVRLYEGNWGEIVKPEFNLDDGSLSRILRTQIEKRVEIFPEGQRVGIDSSTISLAGTIYSILFNSLQFGYVESWNHLTEHGGGTTHNEYGDSLICYAIQTNSTKKGAARLLIEDKKKQAEKLGRRLFVFTRPDGLRAYAEEQGWDLSDQSNIERYLEGLEQGKIKVHDGVSFHRHHDAVLSRLLRNEKPYLPNSRPFDVNSLGYNVLMEYPVK